MASFASCFLRGPCGYDAHFVDGYRLKKMAYQLGSGINQKITAMEGGQQPLAV